MKSLCGVGLSSRCLLVGTITRAVDLCSSATNRCDFLEIECLNEGEELVLRILNRVVDQLIGKEDRVVSHLDLSDSFADTDLELLLCLNSVSDTATQLFETRWVDKQKVAFESLSIDLNSTFDVDLDDGDLV